MYRLSLSMVTVVERKFNAQPRFSDGLTSVINNSMNQFIVSTGLIEGDLVSIRLRLSFLVTYKELTNVCNPIARRVGSKLIYATVKK